MAKSSPAPRLTAADWLSAALEVLGEGGVAAVRVEPLAERLAVSKGSFYWHFADRQALLDGLTAHWKQVATEAVIAHIEREGLVGRARLERLLDISLGSRADRVEGAIRAWSSHDPQVAAVVTEVDAARERFVAKELEKLGIGRAASRRRARTLYLALIGEFARCANGAPPSDRAVFRELLGLLLEEDDVAGRGPAERAQRPR